MMFVCFNIDRPFRLSHNLQCIFQLPFHKPGLSACSGYNPNIPPSSCGSGSGDKKGGKPHRVPSSDPFSLKTPTGLDDPDDSSPSSSDDSGGRGGGPGGNGPDPGSPHFSVDGRYGNRGNASIGIGSNVLGFMSEKDVYRSKGLSLVKLENLPTTASEFRAWKNTFLTKVAAIDQTGRDVILDWVMRAFEEGRDVSEFLDSGLLPRLDSHLGSLLMDTRHLKGELGMRFQTYAEFCQMA